MTTELDREITNLIAALSSESPQPHPWAAVTEWPASEARPAGLKRQWRAALAVACLGLIALAVVAIAGRDASKIDDAPAVTTPATISPTTAVTTTTTVAPPTVPPTTVAAQVVSGDEMNDLAPLADITLSSIPLPTDLPPDADFDPLVVRPPQGSGERYTIRFDDDATMTVWSSPGPWRGEVGSETMTQNGTTWSVMESSAARFQAIGTIGETLIVIFSEGHERAIFDRLIAGLRTGSITDYPGITYNIETDGAEVAGLADDVVTLDVRRDGQWRCWSLKSDVFSDNGGCTDDAVPTNGVLILSDGGTGIPENSSANAAIVTSIVRQAGVAPLNSTEIEIEYIDGQILRFPIENRAGGSDEGYFVALASIDGNAFGGDSSVVSIVPILPE